MPSIPRASSPSNAPSASASPSSQWHSITPTTRPLNLEILEVTSLSLTVALTLAYPPAVTASSPSRNQSHPSGSITKHRRKHRSRPTDSEDELTAVEDEFTGPGGAPPYISSAFPGTYPLRLPLSPNARPSFKELLSKGVVVTVNGRPWNRIVAHVSDDEEDLTFTTASNSTNGDAEARQSMPTRRMGNDRAVVVIYGLLPGNEYQVDLKVVGNLDHEGAAASTSITTANQPSAPASSQSSANRSRANSIRKGGRSRSSSLLQNVSNPVSAPEETLVTIDGHLAIPHPESTAPVESMQPPDSRSPQDAETNNLRHMISNVALEKEDLLGQLKRSRRESQRTEATLRSEIEALKRAIDKTTQPDQRSRQKSLALQEQVKQAWNAAAEAESQHDLILNGMGGLHGAEASLRKDWGKARKERDHAVEERDEAIEEDRKAMEKLDGELQTLLNRLDKQKMKKAKIAKENDELRQKLEEVASAQREVEKRNDSIRQQRMMVDDYGSAGYGRMWDYDVPWGGRYGPMQHPNDTPGPYPADLQNLMRGRQLGGGAGSYAGVRPFYPSNATASTSSSSAARAGSAAMATQGLPPRSGTALTSHLGNPIGFFPPSSSVSATQRSFRVVSREGAPGSGGSANATPVSPLMANVTAAPFMPSRQPPSADFGYGYDHQTTSLVPPQLQHRIYLPSTRSRLSPTFGQSIVAGRRVAGEEGGEAAPAFPPLPSQGSVLNSAKTMPSGPSLASIVTRAIIPSGPSPVSSAPTSASLQKSPTGSLPDPAMVDGAAVRPIISPGISRHQSWGAGAHPKATSLFLDGMDNHGGQPAGGEEFPFLPLSPSSPWGPTASPSGGPARQIIATPPSGSGPNSSNSSSASGWGRPGGPSRRSSLQATPGMAGTPPASLA